MSTLEINVHDITRVEGHGNLIVRARDGTVEECKLEITEPPRLFEAMLVARDWTEASIISCRICGICSNAHTLTSWQAAESAMGIELSEQTLLLRNLLEDGEQLSSHILHLYFLVAPDQFRTPSVIPLASSHPDVVKRALRLKKVANQLCAIIVGKHTHAPGGTVGGFLRIPTVEELRSIRTVLAEIEPDIKATVELFSSLTWPEFERETEYVSITDPEKYTFYSGDLISSEGDRVPPADYKEIIREKVVPHSTAKHSSHKRDSIQVGALARFNNNYDKLRPEAAEAANKLGLKPPCHNPFMISSAQLVESVNVYYDAIDILDTLIARGTRLERPSVKPRAGRGVGVTEAPRGTLVHDYTYNENGIITDVNIITPTAINCANIEQDIRAFTPQIIDKPKGEVRFLLEMLVGAYDPCISCSVHYLDITFA